jgi:arsenite methyltransferase
MHTPGPLFARADFQRVAGEALRPGGLALTRRALELCPLQQEAVVLDAGCGRGATARLLCARGHKVLALDLSTALLRQACAPGVSPLLARVEALPLATHSVDAVFCECVISVTGRGATVLNEVARTLKPGGWLVMSDLYLREPGGAAPQFDAPFIPQGDCGLSRQNDCVAGALPLAELSSQLREAGFAVRAFEDHSRLLTELAAQLIFAGLPVADLCGPPGCNGAKPGYFLCLAQMPGD